MSESNVIYEITQMMTDKNKMKDDMNEATNLVLNMFKKKYIDRLQNEMNDFLSKEKKNPAKEVKLLHSLKPFMHESKHEHIDYMIDLFSKVNALQAVQKKFKPNNISKEQPTVISSTSSEILNSDSIHQDGIYDFDEKCLISNNSHQSKDSNLFGLMFLFMLSDSYRIEP